MKYRALDGNYDYTFGNNASNFISGNKAIAQAIKTKLLLFYGEWFENIAIGIPMFQSILGQVSTENIKMTVTMLCTERIMEVAGVASVDSIEVSEDNRRLSLFIKVTTADETSVEVGVNL